MGLLERDLDTICALSTPPGHGGIAVVRVSGNRALEIVRQMADFLPEPCQSHRVYFGKIKAPVSKDVIDEVLISYFAKGRSFTGEETLEISTHGSPQIVALLLEQLSATGCRPAEKGEFTYRSFMNGKLDLVQAEAVLSLIESQSRRAAKNASRQLVGELSKEFQWIESKLIHAMAHLEAGIDFSHEDIEPYEQSELTESIQKIRDKVDILISSYGKGRVIREGFRVVIVGRPNAGKSSLLNAIASYDCAIVTDIPGTTRDVVSAEKVLAGMNVRFVDTAGIRETEDKIESIGIQRSIDEAGQADLVLLLMDLSVENLHEDLRLIEEVSAENLFIVGNKKDISKFGADLTFSEYLLQSGIDNKNTFEISAKENNGIEELLQKIEVLSGTGLVDESHLVTSSRQVKGLQNISNSLKRTMLALEESQSPEFIVFELQEAVLSIHSLLGKEYDDQVMDHVFSEFCIGK